MATKILTTASRGKDDPEHATLPFIVANVAAAADQEATVLLFGEAVWLATKGYADSIQRDGFPALKEVIHSLLANGGRIWACGTCTKPRGITERDLIDGGKIVTAANVVEYLAQGASTLSF